MEPAFIPKEELDPHKEYRGYVARPNGLVRKDRETFTGSSLNGTGPRLKKVEVPLPNRWGVDPVKRRTPQERLNSVAMRIVAQLQTSGGVLPESVFQEVQEFAWAEGHPISMEQVKALARAYLERGEKLNEEAQQGKVTRQSPYALSQGRAPTKHEEVV